MSCERWHLTNDGWQLSFDSVSFDFPFICTQLGYTISFTNPSLPLFLKYFHRNNFVIRIQLHLFNFKNTLYKTKSGTITIEKKVSTTYTTFSQIFLHITFYIIQKYRRLRWRLAYIGRQMVMDRQGLVFVWGVDMTEKCVKASLLSGVSKRHSFLWDFTYLWLII